MALTRGLDLVPVGAEEALAELGVPGAGGHRGAPLASVVEPGQALVLPLSTVLSVTMTQIVSTLASSLQGAWHPGHTQSALHCTAL